ncbi:hypothetical protein [Phytohabitans suffuscus]|uniref:hypothetical protein n=1 Tax=Phytohabitans suffuscus TaxID=624315 RepID=UPI0018D8E045|nr:hypothetical protein [Phytohabitans suffuscus]
MSRSKQAQAGSERGDQREVEDRAGGGSLDQVVGPRRCREPGVWQGQADRRQDRHGHLPEADAGQAELDRVDEAGRVAVAGAQPAGDGGAERHGGGHGAEQQPSGARQRP